MYAWRASEAGILQQGYFSRWIDRTTWQRGFNPQPTFARDKPFRSSEMYRYTHETHATDPLQYHPSLRATHSAEPLRVGCVFRPTPTLTLRLYLHCNQVLSCVVVTVVRIFLGSYIFGSLLHIMVFKDILFEEHTKRMHMLQVFCTQRALPNDLRRDLLEHFKYQFKRRQEAQKSTSLGIPLPESLEQAVAECAYSGILDKCVTLPSACMQGVSPSFMRAVAVLLQEIYCRPDELLLQMNDMSFQVRFAFRP